MNTFRCIRICDNAVCISVYYPASLHFVFHFATPAFCLQKDYFFSFEMCQEVRIRSVLLLLQFGHYRTDFTTFFLLHCEFTKQQFQTFTNSLKDICLVKRKPFLSQLLLSVFLVVLEVPTHTLEEAAQPSKRQTHYKDQPLVAQDCKTLPHMNEG